MPKTNEEVLFITHWIFKRYDNGILLGPFTEENCPFPYVHFSPLFTVPRPDLRARTVCHLSSPKRGVSVNDCIPDDAKVVSYIQFREVAEFVYNLGVDAQLWLVDAKDAYYRLPIKRKYWKYMGIKFFDYIFVFTSLQMGLGSGCALYQRFADSIIYILRTKYCELFIDEDRGELVFHYLDDFFGGHPKEDVAKSQMLAVWKLFILLGIPTQDNKLKWPNWLQIILGWLYNTRLQTVSLPPLKVEQYSAMIIILLREKQKGTNKKTYERLDGRLQHSSVVVFPGKTRLRNLQHALHLEDYSYDDTIYMNDLIESDLRWFLYSLKYSNGIPLTWVFYDPVEFDDEIWTDAALRGDLKIGGMGGCTTSGVAYQVHNSQTMALYLHYQRKGVDIHLMELIAMYIMAAHMAPHWRYKHVRFYCDNKAASWALINKRANLGRRDMEYVTMRFCQLSAKYHFRFWIKNIKGEENQMADALSRFKTSYKNNVLDMSELEFLNVNDIIQTVDELLFEIEKLPLNDDDPRRKFFEMW